MLLNRETSKVFKQEAKLSIG